MTAARIERSRLEKKICRAISIKARRAAGNGVCRGVRIAARAIPSFYRLRTVANPDHRHGSLLRQTEFRRQMLAKRPRKAAVLQRRRPGAARPAAQQQADEVHRRRQQPQVV